MKLSELKSGMIVEVRIGHTYLVFKDECINEIILIRSEGFETLNNIKENLTNTHDNDYDITAVYTCKNSRTGFNSRLEKKCNLTPIWKRKNHIDYSTYKGKICKFWDIDEEKLCSIGVYKGYDSNSNSYIHSSYEDVDYKFCKLLTEEEIEQLQHN